MATKIDPQLTLIALALFHEPDQLSFKVLRSVYNPSAIEFAGQLQSLRRKGYLDEVRSALTKEGVRFLKSEVPDCLLAKQQKPASIYRAFVGSILLSASADAASFRTLSDGRSVCAGLAARLLDGEVQLPFDSPRDFLALAVRTVIHDFLRRSIPTLTLSPPGTQSLGKDRLLVDLFAAATGAKDWDTGFRRLAASALNTSLIPKTDGRWRKLSKAGFDSMARSASHQQQAKLELSAIVGVIDRVARGTPTGWVPIFKAFEAYREVNRVALAEFKAAVEAAARADKLELAALNVPSLQNDNERAQSALVMGGLTYHLVRLPK